MKKTHWVLDGEIIEDAGDVGGDIQVDRAISARFRSDDCPEARFEVTAYATAKTYMELGESNPDCPHGTDGLRSEAHLACSWKPGTVDVQAQYEFRMDGTVDEYGNYDSSNDHITYEWVGSPYDYPGETLSEQIRNATKDAKATIKDWVANVNQYLHWDGRTNPMD